MQVADGIWWLRLTLDSVLDHVNVYLLEEETSWTLVDTGSHTDRCRSELEEYLAHPSVAHKPIRRVIATHYHPDHIGLAGWLVERGAELWATQLCWLYARMLQLDDRALPCEAQIQFAVQAGIKGLTLEAYRRHRPSHYSQLVYPLPFSYHRLNTQDQVQIGKRTWTVHVGHGHAAGHATLWSEDNLAITGDQILPAIATNLSVHPSEPRADLVSEWLESCHRFAKIAKPDTLCLPGHNVPFRGAPLRCQQLCDNVEAALQRLWQRLEKPATAVECLEAMYRRPLDAREQSPLVAETVGYLNHLEGRGLARFEMMRDGTKLWRRTPGSLFSQQTTDLRK